MLQARLLTPFLTVIRRFVTEIIPAAIWSAGFYRLPGLAAEMAYNWMLGLFPLILMALTTVGLFSLNPQDTYDVIKDQLSRVAPTDAVAFVDLFVKEISYGKNFSLFSASFLATLWGASGALSAAMIALDMSHRVPPQVLRSFWHRRALSILLTVGIMVLTGVASFLLFFNDRVLEELVRQADQLGFTPVGEDLAWVGTWFDYPIGVAMLILSCITLYRFGPSYRMRGIPLVPGALCASVLWVIASSGLQLYVSNFNNFNRAYGFVGSFIVLLLWLWLSSLVLLLGEQINIALYRHGFVGPRARLLREAQPQLPSGSPWQGKDEPEQL